MPTKIRIYNMYKNNKSIRLLAIHSETPMKFINIFNTYLFIINDKHWPRYIYFRFGCVCLFSSTKAAMVLIETRIFLPCDRSWILIP